MTPQEAMATVPKTIKIGPHTYSITIVDVVSDGSDSRAFVDNQAQAIEIARSNASSSAAVGSLIHELLHAIWDDRNLGKRPDEERVVLAFESGLVQLFQHSPKLLTWIKRGLR